METMEEVKAKLAACLEPLKGKMPAGYVLAADPVSMSDEAVTSKEEYDRIIGLKIEPQWLFVDLRDHVPSWGPVPASWVNHTFGEKDWSFLFAFPSDRKAAEKIDPLTLLPGPVQESLNQQPKISTAFAAYLRQLIGKPGCTSGMTRDEVREWLRGVPRGEWAFLRGAEERRDAPQDIGTVQIDQPPETNVDVDVTCDISMRERRETDSVYSGIVVRVTIPRSWMDMEETARGARIAERLYNNRTAVLVPRLQAIEPNDVIPVATTLVSTTVPRVASVRLVGQQEEEESN